MGITMRVIKNMYKDTIMSVKRNDLYSFIMACAVIRNHRNDGLINEEIENQLFSECLKGLEGRKDDGKIISIQQYQSNGSALSF